MFLYKPLKWPSPYLPILSYHEYSRTFSVVRHFVHQWEQKLSRPDTSLTSFWIPLRKANEDQAEQICLLHVSSGSFFSGLIFQFQQKLEWVEGRASWHIDLVINGPERSLLALADVWAQPSLQGWIISRSTISSWFFSPNKCLKTQIRSIFYVPKGGKWIVVLSCSHIVLFGKMEGHWLTHWSSGLFVAILLIKCQLAFLFLSAQPSAKRWHLS